MASGLEELGITDDSDDRAATTATEAPSDPVPPPSADADEAERQDLLIRALRQIALFDGLLPVHLRRISALVHDLAFERGEAIFNHGDDGDGLYLILSGSVRISRSVSGIGEEALAILKPGMYFGEMSLIDDDVPRSADAIAHEPTRVLKLPKDDLRDLMFVDRELAYELLWRFVRTMSARLRESNDRLLMLTVSSKF